jgi:hypothetical protein
MMEDEVYILWDMHADSWNGTRTMISIHKTLEGADKAALKEIKTSSLDQFKREAHGSYVLNYTYLAIEKITLGD